MAGGIVVQDSGKGDAPSDDSSKCIYAADSTVERPRKEEPGVRTAARQKASAMLSLFGMTEITQPTIQPVALSIQAVSVGRMAISFS